MSSTVPWLPMDQIYASSSAGIDLNLLKWMGALDSTDAIVTSSASAQLPPESAYAANLPVLPAGAGLPGCHTTDSKLQTIRVAAEIQW